MSLDALLGAVFVLFLVYCLMRKRKYKLPPGPWGLPFVGYLPFLGKDPPTDFQQLSKKYGDMFSLYLGRGLVVVLTDVKAGKELLSKSTTLDRPDDFFLLLPGGVGLAKLNGTEWVEQRRYTMAEMKNLGLGKSHWEHLLEEEVSDFIHYVEKAGGQPIIIYDEMAASMSNNVLSLVTGGRLPAGHPKREIIDKGIGSFLQLYDQSGLVSSLPRVFEILTKIGLIDAKQKMKDMEEMSKCVRRKIEELRREENGESFVHKYAAEIEKNQRLNLKNSFNSDNLLGNTQALIIAGSDTTKVSILWLLLAIASRPDIQDKVQEEVDSVLGKDGKAAWADRHKLPYCLAAIHEGQRWRTITPLNLQHMTSEDIQFRGYDIPKGTRLITVLTAFHTDSKYWKNPGEFQPERFLSEDGLTVIEPEAYIPFSAGKRICPGKIVALIEIFHYFVTIVQKFRIVPESEEKPLDLEGIFGVTYHPKRQPLRFIRR